MMKTLLNPTKTTFYFLVFLAMMVVFNACQDDPYLEPTVDGQPVITPKSKVYITAVQLNAFPSTTPTGDSWDAVDSANFDYQGLPDIYFNFTDPSPDPPVFWSQNTHFSNVSDTTPVYYYLLDPYFVQPFGSSIDVNVYDYELPDSTFMGKVNFFLGEYPDPTEPQTPYPTSVTKIENGYSITLGLRWED